MRQTSDNSSYYPSFGYGLYSGYHYLSNTEIVWQYKNKIHSWRVTVWLRRYTLNVQIQMLIFANGLGNLGYHYFWFGLFSDINVETTYIRPGQSNVLPSTLKRRWFLVARPCDQFSTIFQRRNDVACPLGLPFKNCPIIVLIRLAEF